MKSKFKTRKLGDLITEVSLRNNKNEISEVFSVTNSEGFIKSTDYFDKEVFSKNISNYKIVKPNQFAYNPSRINVGSIDFLKTDFDVTISPLYIVFQCENSLLPDYLLRYLKSPVGIAQIRSKTRGAVRDNLAFSSLSDVNIPIGSILEQRKIIKLLSDAERLLEKRQISISYCDKLIQDAFYKFFGDPYYNTRNFPVVKLGECFSLEPQNGVYVPLSEYGKGTKILRIDSFNDGQTISVENLKKVNISGEVIEKYSLVENDIIINRVNSRELLGKIGIVPHLEESVVFESNMMRFAVKEKVIRPTYLLKLFLSPFIKSQIRRAAKDAVNQSSINQQDIKSINIVLPPIELQKSFEYVVERTNQIKQKLISSQIELKKLYWSISSSAFRGNLNLNSIEFEHDVPVTSGGNDSDQNIKITPKSQNKKAINKKESVLKAIVNKHFKTQPFNFEDLAEKVQASLVNEEYDYSKIKQEVFNSLRGNGEILLKQVFDEKEKKLLLQTAK